MKNKIREIIREILNEREIPDNFPGFDEFEFLTNAKEAFLNDLKESSEEFHDIGTKENIEDFITAAKVANLRLEKDIQNLEKLAKEAEKAKGKTKINKMEKMMGAGSYN